MTASFLKWPLRHASLLAPYLFLEDIPYSPLVMSWFFFDSCYGNSVIVTITQKPGLKHPTGFFLVHTSYSNPRRRPTVPSAFEKLRCVTFSSKNMPVPQLSFAFVRRMRRPLITSPS